MKVIFQTKTGGGGEREACLYSEMQHPEVKPELLL